MSSPQLSAVVAGDSIFRRRYLVAPLFHKSVSSLTQTLVQTLTQAVTWTLTPFFCILSNPSPSSLYFLSEPPFPSVSSPELLPFSLVLSRLSVSFSGLLVFWSVPIGLSFCNLLIVHPSFYLSLTVSSYATSLIIPFHRFLPSALLF